MAKQYGLIVSNKGKGPGRPSIFDEDSDSDGQTARPTGLKKPLKKQDKITQNRAVEEDPTVYQYDEIYDEMDKKRKESKLSRKDLDRKPKYISRLLAAADKRKKENERRIERQVQKEREAEGEEFKDKESFVTSAYRKKLEEMKEEEAQERREEYLEAIGDVRKQGNLDGFYRHLYDQKVNYEHKIKQENDEIGESSQETEKTPTEASDKDDHEEDDNKKKGKKRKYRQRESPDKSDNENGDEEVKKEHLPSNLDADSDFSIDSSDSDDENNETKTVDKIVAPEPKAEETAKEEPKTETIDKKPEESLPKKAKIDIWKKRTVGDAFDAALQRYFERRALREL